MRRSLIMLIAATSLSLAGGARSEEPRTRALRAPVPLDGVAAIVEDIVVFRSEIAERARRFEDRLSKNPIERRSQLVTLEKEMLAHLIDEILMTKDAAKLKLEATDVEVSAGIASVAAANNIDRKKLEGEILKQGYTAIEYQEEIRRQIIEQKWLMLRAGGKIDRKKAPDVASFQAALAKQRELLLVELRGRAYIEIR